MEYLFLIWLPTHGLGGAIWASLLSRIANLEFHIRLPPAGPLGLCLVQFVVILARERIEHSNAASGRLVDPGSGEHMVPQEL